LFLNAFACFPAFQGVTVIVQKLCCRLKKKPQCLPGLLIIGIMFYPLQHRSTPLGLNYMMMQMMDSIIHNVLFDGTKVMFF